MKSFFRIQGESLGTAPVCDQLLTDFARGVGKATNERALGIEGEVREVVVQIHHDVKEDGTRKFVLVCNKQRLESWDDLSQNGHCKGLV